MNSDTIKRLILAKIIDVYAPKIVGYYNILNNVQENSVNIWSPNINYLGEDYKNSEIFKHTNIRVQ